MPDTCFAIFLINVYIRDSKKSPIAEANTNFLGKITGELNFLQGYIIKKNTGNYDKGLIFVWMNISTKSVDKSVC